MKACIMYNLDLIIKMQIEKQYVEYNNLTQLKKIKHLYKYLNIFYLYI